MSADRNDADTGGQVKYVLELARGAKAQAETPLRAMGYPFFTIVRPSLIDPKRDQARPLECAAIVVARILKPLIPYRYRAVKPNRIARALIDGVLADAPGERIIESDQLQD